MKTEAEIIYNKILRKFKNIVSFASSHCIWMSGFIWAILIHVFFIFFFNFTPQIPYLLQIIKTTPFLTWILCAWFHIIEIKRRKSIWKARTKAKFMSLFFHHCKPIQKVEACCERCQGNDNQFKMYVRRPLQWYSSPKC